MGSIHELILLIIKHSLPRKSRNLAKAYFPNNNSNYCQIYYITVNHIVLWVLIPRPNIIEGFQTISLYEILYLKTSNIGDFFWSTLLRPIDISVIHEIIAFKYETMVQASSFGFCKRKRNVNVTCLITWSSKWKSLFRLLYRSEKNWLHHEC